MAIALYLLIALPLATLLLAASLWIMADRDRNPFREYGVGGALLRCFGLVLAVRLLILASILMAWEAESGVLALLLVGLVLAVWLVGIMALFEQNFGFAVLLTGVNWVLGLGLNVLLELVVVT
jgi:hypothetical protein